MNLKRVMNLNLRRVQSISSEKADASDIKSNTDIKSNLDTVLKSLKSDEVKKLQKNLEEIREIVVTNKDGWQHAAEEKMNNLMKINPKIGLLMTSILGFNTGTLMGIVHNQKDILQKLDNLSKKLDNLNKKDIKKKDIKKLYEDEKYLKMLAGHELKVSEEELMKKEVKVLAAGLGITAAATAAIGGVFGLCLFDSIVTAIGGILLTSVADFYVIISEDGKKLTPLQALERLKQGIPIEVDGYTVKSLQDLEVFIKYGNKHD